MTQWLLFTYKVPNEPSARRVYVWRKLKELGAISLHDSLWVLPDRPPTREKLQWLTTEVREMEGGDATLWVAQQVFTGQDGDLTRAFIEQAEVRYREILAELDRADADVAALAKRFQHIQRQDYFHAPLGEQVRQTLIDRRGDEA